jgi:hypothetical protein
MDRSNFNPDQLHEHFDRLKNDLGIELEDNARMIRLPTGHRFVLGQGAAMRGRHGDIDTFFSLQSEAGEVGRLATSSYTDKVTDASIIFDKDNSRRVGTKRTSHNIRWTNSPDVGNPPEDDERDKWYNNPDSETMDSVVNEVLERGGDSRPDTLKGAGTIQIEGYSGTRSEGFGWDVLGNVAMNRKSGRFEWIPD